MPSAFPTSEGSAPSTASPRAVTVGAIHAHVGGELMGDPDMPITGVNALENAQPGEVAFAESAKYLGQVRQTRASAVIVGAGFPPVERRTILRVGNPRLAFIKVMYLFEPQRGGDGTIHRQAVVASDAELGEGVTVRECAVVRSRARIGAGTVIESGACIGEGVVIGASCLIGPNVTIMPGSTVGNRVIIHGGTVVGADGFGYVWVDGRHLKIPQLGRVIIEDDVELGANVCVDRATFGSTVVGRGTKVDNLVQIAHNDIIGEHVIMSGQAGLAGSVQIGNRVMMGGQAGIVDHIKIGDDARIGAASVVTKDIPSGQTFWGYPARQIQRVKRELAALAFLPQIVKRVNRPLQRSRGPKR